jgi:hypothetical protein
VGVGSTTVFACGWGVGGRHSLVALSFETAGVGVGLQDSGAKESTVSATGNTGGAGLEIDVGGHSSSETIGAGAGSQDAGESAESVTEECEQRSSPLSTE